MRAGSTTEQRELDFVTPPNVVLPRRAILTSLSNETV
jgi:hypothetical protein